LGREKSLGNLMWEGRLGLVLVKLLASWKLGQRMVQGWGRRSMPGRGLGLPSQLEDERECLLGDLRENMSGSCWGRKSVGVWGNQ
jgi:hypothetical protein